MFVCGCPLSFYSHHQVPSTPLLPSSMVGNSLAKPHRFWLNWYHSFLMFQNCGNQGFCVCFQALSCLELPQTLTREFGCRSWFPGIQWEYTGHFHILNLSPETPLNKIHQGICKQMLPRLCWDNRTQWHMTSIWSKLSLSYQLSMLWSLHHHPPRSDWSVTLIDNVNFIKWHSWGRLHFTCLPSQSLFLSCGFLELCLFKSMSLGEPALPWMRSTSDRRTSYPTSRGVSSHLLLSVPHEPQSAEFQSLKGAYRRPWARALSEI